jgi:5-methylthioribose kinase
MREIDANTAEAYLRETGRVAADRPVRICELTGGVSNVVLLAEPEGQPAFVLKQARPQLRVAQPWFCSVERIWREVAVLRICQRVLESSGWAADGDVEDEFAADVPRLLLEDRENFLYAMTAAPPHTVWKAELLAGNYQDKVAASCGRLLGTLHSSTWQDARVARELDDRQFFLALRIDPYYRRVAEVHPALREPLEEIIASQNGQRRCLVHGDFSPKNLLVHAGGLTLVDFEVGHFGDPAFDLGFFLSHLVLKSIHAGRDGGRLLALSARFWTEYRAAFAAAGLNNELPSTEARAVANFAACALARVDGKSPVDYLNEQQQESVRRLCAAALRSAAESWRQVEAIIEDVRRSG